MLAQRLRILICFLDNFFNVYLSFPLDRENTKVYTKVGEFKKTMTKKSLVFSVWPVQWTSYQKDQISGPSPLLELLSMMAAF